MHKSIFIYAHMYVYMCACMYHPPVIGKIMPLPCGQIGRAKAKGVHPDRNSGVEPCRQIVGKIDHLLATPASWIISSCLDVLLLDPEDLGQE